MMLKGVYKAKKKNGDVYFRSSITYKNKHISIGSYPTEQKAHEAYLCASALLSSTSGVTEWHSLQPLSFEKWVILANFRDNGLYFRSPIYLHKRYFSYYISPKEELFFDVDDLFYYGRHPIHTRDGYYFVNDYGMQVNILSRYGIKNHAVVYRDYEFIDGDSNNYRYDNIHVINPYYGVTRELSKQETIYKTTININGSVIVGRYNLLEDAAIAYNKAIDYLNVHLKTPKSYTPNYIEEMSSTDYKHRYENISISSKLLPTK